jgi:hypothetical protein
VKEFSTPREWGGPTWRWVKIFGLIDKLQPLQWQNLKLVTPIFIFSSSRIRQSDCCLLSFSNGVNNKFINSCSSISPALLCQRGENQPNATGINIGFRTVRCFMRVRWKASDCILFRSLDYSTDYSPWQTAPCLLTWFKATDIIV